MLTNEITTMKGLFEKRIDLKNSQINGGKLASSCMSECWVRTGTTNSPDGQYTYYNDDGSVRSVRTVQGLSNAID